MDIIGILLASLQSIAIVLVIVGLIMAFLWKVAFYIGLGLGLIITLIATFLVYDFTTRIPGIGIHWVFLVFFVGLVATVIQAVKAAIMAIVNGFFLTWLGIFLLLIRGQIFDLSRLFGELSGTLLGSAVGAGILVGISAYAGGHMLEMPTFRFPSVRRTRRYEPPKKQEPIYPKRTQGVSQKEIKKEEPKAKGQTEVRFVDYPTSDSCEICKEEWVVDSQVCKCSECETNFHRDCIQEYLNKYKICPKCQRSARLDLLD